MQFKYILLSFINIILIPIFFTACGSGDSSSGTKWNGTYTKEGYPDVNGNYQRKSTLKSIACDDKELEQNLQYLVGYSSLKTLVVKEEKDFFGFYNTINDGPADNTNLTSLQCALYTNATFDCNALTRIQIDTLTAFGTIKIEGLFTTNSFKSTKYELKFSMSSLGKSVNCIYKYELSATKLSTDTDNYIDPIRLP